MVQLGQNRVVVRGRTVADYALMEAQILNERGNVFDCVRRTARQLSDSADAQRGTIQYLIEKIGRRWCATNLMDVFEWINTWRGRVFSLWLAVRDNNRAFYTYERIVRCAGQADWSRIASAMDQASANDERCAAHWFGLGGEWDASMPFWPMVFRRLAEAPFHMHPETVGRLTLQQLRFYLGDSASLKEHFEFATAGALNAWRSRRRAVMDRSIDNVLCGRRWNAELP
jgi:hypothetical protein